MKQPFFSVQSPSSGTIAISGATAADTLVDFREVQCNGDVWVQLKPTVVTSGMSSVKIEAVPAILVDGTMTKYENGKLELDAGFDLSTTSKVYFADLTMAVAQLGDHEKCMSPFGVYIRATGQAGDDGELEVDAFVK